MHFGARANKAWYVLINHRLLVPLVVLAGESPVLVPRKSMGQAGQAAGLFLQFSDNLHLDLCALMLYYKNCKMPVSSRWKEKDDDPRFP
jgi:hypothetical protein